MRPVLLPANQPKRFYAGGAAIARLRGEPAPADHTPEDWVASTTTLFGDNTAGLSVLEDGRSLRAAVAADPVGFLGPEHVAGFGPGLGILIKLLDAGERLPVHVHPDRAFAVDHLGCAYGKTEAWYVIDVGNDDAAVYVGFRAAVAQAELSRWVRDQAAEAMLAALNRVPVHSGDTVLVPAGTVHAIGAGVFVCELQEPTDLSVLLEWRRLPEVGSGEASLGMEWSSALACVRRDATLAADLQRLQSSRATMGPVTPLFPDAADPFFRADLFRLEGLEVTLAPELSILVVLDGTGELRGAFGEPVPLTPGATVLVPWDAGDVTLVGELTTLRCRPPKHPPLDPRSAAKGAS